MNIEEKILETLKTFPPDKQQEVLNFMESLRSNIPAVEIKIQESKPSISALELAEKWAGCLDGGPDDLSSNKQHLEGYGL